MSHKVAIIGSGFAGLSAACTAAAAGCEVVVFEKNSSTGGRARFFSDSGFLFDMGPSWYWMPDVFEDFFARFEKKVSDYYSLDRLDPSYRVFFDDNTELDVPASLSELKVELEKLEKGSGQNLDKFLAEAKVKYETGMNEFVWKPSLSLMEFANFKLIRESFRLQLFANMRSHLRGYFSHPKILKLLEFPVLFLGAKPSKTPALYSMMNYADIALGTWYPQGGMAKIPEAMTALAIELGVKFELNAEVQSIEVNNGRANALVVNGNKHTFDSVIGAADYHHIESKLLTKEHRDYDEAYWSKRVMSPSSLLFYVGINKKVDGLLHHNLFFDESFDQHAVQIYDTPQWPEKPLFYVCCPSKTDKTVAPEGCENLFILIPVAPDMSSTEEERNYYFDMCIKRIEARTGSSFMDNIVFRKSYAHEEFVADYNSFKGNAYGLANTLMQTAFLKPRMRSKKVKNLFFAGQLTVPGPGVPPSIISGQVAANEVLKYLNIQAPLSV